MEGTFALVGPPDVVAGLGPRVAAVLDGRGGGRKGMYQGKCKQLNKRRDVEALLRAEVAGAAASESAPAD